MKNQTSNKVSPKVKRWLSKTITLATLALLLLILAACSSASPQTASQGADVPEGAVLVEIAYLGHGPVRPILAEFDALVAEYGDSVAVLHYDFGTPEGEAFAEERDLTDHTPIAIFVNGEMEVELDGRAVKFYSFPQGQGTDVVPDGVWTMADLQAVLDLATAE